jgi:DNA-binding CsgD family transcriptional regulator
LSFLAPSYAYAGRRAESEETIARLDEIAGEVEADDLRAKIFNRMGIAAVSLVLPLERVMSLFMRAQTLASDHGLYFTAAAAFGGLSTAVLLYEDDITKSVWFAQQAMNAALKAGDRFSLQTSLIQLIHIETRRGNGDRLKTLEEQFAAATTTDASRSFYVVPARAMMAAWEARFDDAYRLISGIADRSFYDFDRLFNASMRALYAIGAGKRDAALELTSKTLETFGESSFPYLYGNLTAEVARTICAVVEALAGRPSIAQRVLGRKPLAEAPTVEAVRSCAAAILRMVKNPALVAEVDEALEQLRAVGHGGISMVLERVVAGCIDEQSETGPLTKTELQVLSALAQGNSPKEIAQQAGRSVYTVQAHIQNIIRKLGCSGRNEALTVARRRGLVS